MNAAEFRSTLLENGLLVESGVRGIYHRSFEFETIVRGVENYVSVAGRDERNRQLFCSSIIADSTLVKSGYLTSFPNLIGNISSFTGREAELPALRERVESRDDWAELLSPIDVALCSAGCHGVYPLLETTPIPGDGLYYEVQTSCFRHEPSDDLARMRSFRQHEFVYVGTAEGALSHRDRWLSRGMGLMASLGLSVEAVVANDPFFGRAGQLLAAGQREKALKYEIVAPITSDVASPISSANCHENHFGDSFGLTLIDGSVAHSACIGFGLERITLALLWRHGLSVEQWPTKIKQLLCSEIEQSPQSS